MPAVMTYIEQALLLVIIFRAEKYRGMGVEIGGVGMAGRKREGQRERPCVRACVCAYVRACVCVCVCVCVRERETHTHKQRERERHTHIRMHARTHALTHARTRTHACTHAHTHTHTHKHRWTDRAIEERACGGVRV